MRYICQKVLGTYPTWLLACQYMRTKKSLLTRRWKLGGGSPGGNGGNGDSVSVDGSNTGINVPTDTNQKQDCLTAGASSGITNSCTASSTNTVTQSGGILKK